MLCTGLFCPSLATGIKPQEDKHLSDLSLDPQNLGERVTIINVTSIFQGELDGLCCTLITWNSLNFPLVWATCSRLCPSWHLDIFLFHLCECLPRSEAPSREMSQPISDNVYAPFLPSHKSEGLSNHCFRFCSE